jgi:o-succinylbenzoate synthase
VKPSISALKTSARVVSVPLRTRFRGLIERELLIFEGSNGFSEWAAFPEYPDEEAALWLQAAIEWAFDEQPEPVRTSVPVNAILPAVPVSEIAKILNRAASFQSVKIKVAENGQAPIEDFDRIVEVKNLYPEVKIRLDANGNMSVANALDLIEKLINVGISLQYFEQPVSTIADLAELKLEITKRGLETLVAADESVRKSTDPLAVELAGAADLLVLKSAPLGGITQALGIAASSSLAVIPSSAMQSSIGLAAELHFAASLPTLDYDAGLGTGRLFAGDLVKDPLVAENGVIELRVPEVNLSALDTLKAEDHRFDWWIDRLMRCGRLLGLEA